MTRRTLWAVHGDGKNIRPGEVVAPMEQLSWPRTIGIDFGNPLNLVPVAAGVVITVGDTTLHVTDDFQLSGIALGMLVVVGYHLGRLIAPHLRDQAARDEVHELTLLGPNPDVEDPGGIAETDGRFR